MASIMVIMMDSKNGSVTSTFDLDDKDAQRIYDAYLYKDQATHQSRLDQALTQDDKQMIGDFDPPSSQDICDEISASLINTLVNNTYNTEVQKTIKTLGINPIQVRSK